MVLISKKIAEFRRRSFSEFKICGQCKDERQRKNEGANEELGIGDVGLHCDLLLVRMFSHGGRGMWPGSNEPATSMEVDGVGKMVKVAHRGEIKSYLCYCIADDGAQ
jgi:hypothetical protein